MGPRNLSSARLVLRILVWVAMSKRRRMRIDVVCKLFQTLLTVGWRARSIRWKRGESSRYLRIVQDASGGICGPAGPVSLPAVLSSLVSPMGTMDMNGWRDKGLRSDGVQGLLKTTGMAAAPQFQLQRTSRGWVRRKK